jgi:predicted esterase
MTPLVPAELPDLSGKVVFIASGKQDPLVPPQNVAALAAMLEKAGAEVALEWSEAGHQLTSPEIGKAQQWLAKHF